jgi:pyruvate/2-oxoglutarate dehydrogenase complex dihydrolipoamide dehydrogenase (E3) component
MKEGKGGITVSLDGEVDPKERTFDRVLVSVGRRPNPVPGIESTGVR